MDSSSPLTGPVARGTYKLTTRAWVPQPLPEVFAFFGDAHNLNQLTPAFLHFRILTPAPIDMRPGTLITYRIRLRGIPVTWKTRISAWEPPTYFVDEQLRGPYRLWVHAHFFSACDGGTLIEDCVRYRVLGGRLVHELFVRRDLLRIFSYRLDALRRVFRTGPSIWDREPRIRRLPVQVSEERARSRSESLE